MKKIIVILVLIGVGITLYFLFTRKSAIGMKFKKIDPQLVESSERIFDYLTNRQYELVTNRFDQTMVKALPLKKLKSGWEQAIEIFGKPLEKIAVRTGEQDGYRIVIITYKCEKSYLDFRTVYDKQDKIAGMFFTIGSSKLPYNPPEYVDPDSFTEKQAKIMFGKYILPATLTLPKSGDKLPAVVIVHGSGPNDRDGTLGPNKPYKDLAWGLASQGIAVLRYDKRTYVYGDQLDLVNLTLKEETIDDALKAVELMSKQDKIDPQKIYVIGHSLGGMAIPRIAQSGCPIAGFIIMAGCARNNLEDVLEEQINYIYMLDGRIDEKEATDLAYINAQVKNVKGLIQGIQPDTNGLPFGTHPAYWLDLLDYDIVSNARLMTQPVLVLQGLRDYQVTVTDLKGWQEAFADHSDVQFITYDDLNHLFAPGLGMATPQEYIQENHVDSKVILDIAAWIKRE